MPEYGLCDKSPEQRQREYEEAQIRREINDLVKQSRAIETKARQRTVDAENSSIQAAKTLYQTAEILKQIENQMKDIRDTQEAEQQARIEAEQHSEASSQRQIKENRIWQIIAITIGLLTLAATILGLLR